MSLPHIFLIGKDFRPKIIGVYDPAWGEGDIGGYTPGKFKDYKGDTTYDDSIYKDKKCLTFYFRHYLFGNYPGLRGITRLGGRHFHIKYIVSKNTIDPSSVYKKTPDGDILIFADLVRNPPVTIVRGNNSQETIFEIEPHLSAEELEKLSSDINFVVKIKEQYMHAIAKQRELEGENFLANSRALASDMNILLLQEVVNSLIKKQNVLLDQFIKLKLENRERLAQGIQMVEGKHNIAAPWESITLEDTEKSIASIQAELRAITAMTKDNNRSENQKQIVCQMTVNFCGLDYVRRFVGSMTTTNIQTASGVQPVSMPANPTLTTMILHYIQMRDNGQITAQQCDELVMNLLDKTKRDLTNGSRSNPNSAVERLKDFALGTGEDNAGNVNTNVNASSKGTVNAGTVNQS